MPIDSFSQHPLLNDYHMKQEQKSKMQWKSPKTIKTMLLETILYKNSDSFNKGQIL